ncbi:ATP-binding protein [Porifericola rhodea]|uniref:ATP-binding protein n=1 Tax=Porifericola rhodea TaxID=930972 RepID=UPI002665D78C|nr:ATP-binding protein [Porifericola rhodea]WKN32464.1 ATP-binding protein [Porifericola rhodea]
MDKETLEALENALLATPDNVLLRKQVGKGLFKNAEYERAKEHFNIILQKEADHEIKFLLARTYSYLKQYGPALVICEELLKISEEIEVIEFYLQILINDGQLQEAIEQYQFYQAKWGEWKNEAIEAQLKLPSAAVSGSVPGDKEDSYNPFLEKPDTDFSKVGGMEEVKDEIRMKIIQPLQNPELFKAYGKKAGGGILMYGPPGCGKTYLSRATAGEIDSQFMAVGIEEIMDMWLGSSEKNLHEKFEIARKHQPCVLFFDEIDALGSKRNDLKQSAGRNIINQFLKELDGVQSNNEGLLILGATNSPWHMDSAFLRPGRFDRVIFVPPPDQEARKIIMELLMESKPVAKVDYSKIAEKTEGFSGADLKLLVDLSVEDKLKQSMKSGKVEAISTSDLKAQIKRVRPSTKEWFNTAKNYALYSNVSGIYDDIISYLKL